MPDEETEVQDLDISKFESVEKPKKTRKNDTCSLIMDVELEIGAILGEVDISLKKVLDLTKGSIIKLDNKTTEPVKLLANGKEIASGEVVIIEDNFGTRITNLEHKNTRQELL